MTTEEHVANVLENRNSHSLWLLCSRSAVRAVSLSHVEELLKDAFLRKKKSEKERSKDGERKSGSTKSKRRKKKPTRRTKLRALDLRTAGKLIDYCGRTKKYEPAMRLLLEYLGVPKDWAAINRATIDAFTERWGKRGHHIETKYYHVLSTAERKLAARLGRSMDIMTARAYHPTFEFEDKIETKYIVYFWRNQNEFIEHGGGSPGAGAYYDPQSKHLVGFHQTNPRFKREGDIFRSFYHEGWHQYFDYYIPNAPRWFDEGFAEIVAPSVVRGSGVQRLFNESRERVVQWALREGRLIDLRDLIKMSQADFYHPSRVSIAYAQAWSFVYFLLNYKNTDLTLQRRVRRFYVDYFWELQSGTDPVKAVDVVFRDVRFDALETAWRASLRKRS